MNFDSSALPILPTPQELTELNDLLMSSMELLRVYASLERHPRVVGSERSVELFSSCREQLHQDIAILDKQLENLISLSKAPESEPEAKSTAEAGERMVLPDTEPTDMNMSVFEIMRKAFHTEDLFSEQLNNCLRSAQARKHLKLELQLKMIILSADQRVKLLEDRYGYARTKNVLFQGLRRQTTRFLSALSGEKRTDIDR
jgi:hypothetical protein